jgi:hypothetical protein
LGGLSVAQIADAQEHQAHTNCGDRNEVFLGDAKKAFCSLSDVSVRQGNSIDVGNKGGWTVCKIELGNGNNAGKLLLIAQMDGKCPAPPGLAEIACKAKCITF